MTDAPNWKYSINYGPNDEQDWAYLITPRDENVGNLRIHHAMTIATGMNERNAFFAALQAQAKAEDENANCPDCNGVGDWAECGKCSELFGHAIDLRNEALAAAARPRLSVVK